MSLFIYIMCLIKHGYAGNFVLCLLYFFRSISPVRFFVVACKCFSEAAFSAIKAAPFSPVEIFLFHVLLHYLLCMYFSFFYLEWARYAVGMVWKELSPLAFFVWVANNFFTAYSSEYEYSSMENKKSIFITKRNIPSRYYIKFFGKNK